MPSRPEVPLQVGAEFSAEVRSLGNGADGLCRIGDQTVFVPGALPGETIRARIDSVDSHGARARLLAVDTPSADRIEAGCAAAADCAGCRMQVLAPDARREFQRQAFERLVLRRLRSKPELPAIAGPDDWRGERTRIALRFQTHGREFHAGLPQHHGRHPLAIDDCPATDPAAWRVAHAIREEILRRDLRAVLALVVQASCDGEKVQATIVSEAARLPHAQRLAEVAANAGATGIALNVHDTRPEHLLGRRTVPLSGRAQLEERIGDVRLRLNPTTHSEGLRWGSTALVDAVRRLAVPEPVATAVDLFSGSGLLALAVASRAERVIGVDHSKSAVHDAEAGARASELDAEFVESRVLDALPQLERPRPDVVTLDPPRSGIDDAITAGIARILAPPAICVVGRDAGTFARDLLRFEKLGFRVARIEALDADPQVPGLLAVARLERE